MTISAIVAVSAICDGEDCEHCHIELDLKYDSAFETLDVDGYEVWLSEHGWLVVGGLLSSMQKAAL